MQDNKINFLPGKIFDEFECDDLSKKFIEIFYRFTHVNDCRIDELSKYLSIAKYSLEFAKNKLPNIYKIRIFRPNLIEHGFDLDRTIVEILANDIPYLVNSISEIFTKNGWNIYRVFYPIINSARNSHGDLQDILEDLGENSEKNELLIHFQISMILDNQIIEDLEKNIKDIIENVNIVSADLNKIFQKEIEIFSDDELIKDPKLLQEINEFIFWSQKNFIFLGYADFKFDKNNRLLIEETLGTLSLLAKESIMTILNIDCQEKNLLPNDINQYIEIGRLNQKSSVNIRKDFDYICFKIFDIQGNLKSVKLFIGMFENLSHQTIIDIPIVKSKVKYVSEKSQFPVNSLSNKILLEILEDLPREVLFQIDQEYLFNMSIDIINFTLQPKVKLFSFKDKSNKFINNLIFIPKENFTYDLAEKISEFLKSVFGGVVEESIMKFDNSRTTYFYIVLSTDFINEININIEKVEKRLAVLTHRWLDDLYNALIEKYPGNQGKELYNKYKDAFPIAYRERFPADPSALKDLSFIEKASNDKGTVFDLYKLKEDPENIFRLKIYTNDKEVPLYQIMPVIENLGFRALESHTYRITPNLVRAIWVNDYYLSVALNVIPKIADIKLNTQEALQRIWQNLMHNDGLNKLLISASFNWQQVRMVRALIKYMKQVGMSYSQSLIETAINDHFNITSDIFELFDIYFNPHNRNNISEKISSIEKIIEEKLNIIISDIDDKILRIFYHTVKAILRTSYYQTIEGKPKDYISFKFDSSKVPDLPDPRPFREIFFHSKKAKGIHLRAGKVARGGLRWSDRVEDFRTEILGLMKAQNTKNSVIIPVGSKGGFVLTDIHDISQEDIMKEAIEAYKNYLRSMLDITDNIIDGKIIAPQNLVRLDGDDPYLVVAADKGTASFSDIANNISKEYNFWLGDAFASGGSAGYDHKKMGITAKGAWISVVRHFQEMDINVQKDEITVLAIGDMSGDVFGNGMISSDKIRLIAAFNHIHIFIDPEPNSKISFEERKRLFKMARSSWQDYDKNLISEGGGVFERKSKYITLSPQIKSRFNIEEDKIHPNQLINKILKSNYDLLWNGGIGTYIKSSSETNIDVGDKANDLLRVNGNELFCKVIGEGGNLGCTQLGRIEYAMKNGKINTDFIDNSAGVDCSDHEVNIKITFQKALENNKITHDERNKLLSEMTDEVAKLVLNDNYKQTQAITIASINSRDLLALHARLIDKLEEKQILNRKLEFLPQQAEINKRFHEKSGLTRPEISILLAYSKIEIYRQILDSNLPDDEEFNKYLLKYFPEIMQEKFKEEIFLHPLRREIISTVITNKMVNHMGSHFFNLAVEDTGLAGYNIVRAYLTVTEIFQIDQLWYDIEKLDDEISTMFQAKIFCVITKFVQNNIFWLLRNVIQSTKSSEYINKLFNTVKELYENIENLVEKNLITNYHDQISTYLTNNIPLNLANSLCNLHILEYIFDIALIKINTSVKLEEVIDTYFKMIERLNYFWLEKKLNNIKSASFWDELSIKTLKQDLSDKLSVITINSIEKAENFSEWLSNNKKHLERYDALISNLMSMQIIDMPMIVVAIQRLDFLIK